jgi:hypothetical protein
MIPLDFTGTGSLETLRGTFVRFHFRHDVVSSLYILLK